MGPSRRPWGTAGPGSAPPVPAVREEIVEVRHGRPVADPYRRLEDARDPATRAWAADRDAHARAALDALPGRAALAADVAASLAVAEVDVGVRTARGTVTLRRPAGGAHRVLAVEGGADGRRVLLDPADLDPTGAAVLDAVWPSPDGRRVAVTASEPGHASRLRVLDATTGAVVEGPVPGTTHTSVAWLPGGDLVWVRQDRDDPDRRRVLRHRVGADPASDVEVTGPGLDARGLHLRVRTDPAGRWLVVEGVAGTAPGDGLWLARLDGTGTRGPTARRVLDPADGVGARVRISDNGQLWVVTTRDAPRGRLCVADPARPDPADWRELVAEDPATVLAVVRPVGAVAVVRRHRDGADELHRHDAATGRALGSVALPGPGVVTDLDVADGLLRVGWSTPTTPTRVLVVDPATGAVDDPDGPLAGGPSTRRLAHARVHVTAPTTEPAEFAAAPPPRPTVLTGYGGFGQVTGPSYALLAAAWVAAGGVWARAVLRGGGEDGTAGHDAGRGAHLTAGTDDLLAAADALVAEGVTTRDRLALLGVSHGGLRVAQALAARPDAVAAAVAVSPLADLVRSERLGYGRAWRAEYGRADDPVEHAHLLAGSPYHRLRAGVRYPPVLVTASDADTRVDAAHARKLVAALAHATTGPPGSVLLRREVDTGHGARSADREAAHAVDVLAFLAAATGLEIPSGGPPDDPCTPTRPRPPAPASVRSCP